MYMPLNVDIKKAYIFGGERGEGLQKTQKLGIFADEILVIAEEFRTLDEMFMGNGQEREIIIPPGYPSELNEKLYLETQRRVPVHPVLARDMDLEGLLQPGPGVFVVSDLQDRKLNERISRLCQSRGILCNIIDTKDLCTVWFMSLIQTPSLSVAISSRGGAAFFSARLREELQPLIEDRDQVSRILTEVRASLPQGKDRLGVLEKIYKDWKFQRLVKKKKWGEAEERAIFLALKQ